MMERLKEKDDLNIHQFVTEMRSRRTFMVQTMVSGCRCTYCVCVHACVPACVLSLFARLSMVVYYLVTLTSLYTKPFALYCQMG